MTHFCKWIELEKIILSVVSQALKAKNHMLYLICDCRPKTNAIILWDMDHRGGYDGRDRARE
jgi:hypothetical protein